MINIFVPCTCACVCAKSLQLCLTPCDPMDCSPLGSSVHGIFQARIPCPPPGDHPDPRIQLGSPVLQADSLPRDCTCTDHVADHELITKLIIH